MAKNETPNIAIVDPESNEVIVRPMNEIELEQFELDKAAQQLRDAEKAAKELARESARAKLVELGLTAEEIAAL